MIENPKFRSRGVRLKQFVVLSMLATLSSVALATPTFEGVDITPVVEHFRKQIVTLDKSVTTYNWAPQDENPARPAGESDFDYVKHLSKSFWRFYGRPGGKQHMYGIGLYLALDPAYTISYGGYQNWQLIRVEFPVGTRMLDLQNDRIANAMDSGYVLEAQKILKQFNCTGAATADPYFVSGGEEVDPTCQALIRTVFRNHLQVDAFAYGYQATQYKECAPWNGRAFVLLRPEWMQPENIRVFTSKSTTDTEERIRIQTLLFKATIESQLAGPMMTNNFRETIAGHLDQYPDRGIRGSKTICKDGSCVITISFCNPKLECDSVDLAPLVRPGGPTIVAEGKDSTQILWSDLVGKPKSTTVSTWLLNNRFSCDGTLPYETKAGAK